MSGTIEGICEVKKLRDMRQSCFRSMKHVVHLDTYGFFKPDKQYFNGMVVGNVSITRFMKEYCEKDQLEDKNPKNPLGSTKNRENMYDWKRIELQFDFRSK